MCLYSYNTIIFDLDGTLFKSESTFVEAVKRVCASRGIKTPEESGIKSFIGFTMEEVCEHIFGGNFTQDKLSEIAMEISREEKNALLSHGKLYEGVIDILDRLLEEDMTLCICSNGRSEYVHTVLSTFGIKEYFSVIKPRVEGLNKSQLIKQILDETMSSSAMVVGDTNFDMDAAHDTGCLAIGVTYGYGENLVSDFIAHSPSEVYNIIKKINGPIRELSSYIIRNKEVSKPLIVGINGVDTSGKTTFSKELHTYLKKSGFKAQLIHMDDFHNPSAIRNSDSDPIMSYTNNAFDLRRLEKEVLLPIYENGCLDNVLELLDLETDNYTLKKSFNVCKEDIVLVEGVLLFRDPIAKYFDLRLFLDISFEQVLKRAYQRDYHIMGERVIQKYKEKYIPIQENYLNKWNPKEKSNVVINNEDYNNPKIEKIDLKSIMVDGAINLEPMKKKYIEKIAEILEDPEAKEMLGVIDKPNISNYIDKNTRSFIIEENGEILGVVELFNISWKNRRAELSIVLKSVARGRGYGYEAIQRILQFGFEDLGLNRIWLRVLESNERALNLYQRVGFVREGLCREESLRKGKFVNQIQMSILKREWVKGNINNILNLSSF